MYTVGEKELATFKITCVSSVNSSEIKTCVVNEKALNEYKTFM